MAGAVNRGRVALVTGANRGLGLETCRQLAGHGLRVVLAARDADAAREAAEQLCVAHVQLDVTDAQSISRAAAELTERYGRIDVLVNNAGVIATGNGVGAAEATIEVNTYGAMSVTEAFRPSLTPDACVVLVSSGMGELSGVSPALRQLLEDPDLTQDGLIELMRGYLSSATDGALPDSGWPSSAYSASKVGLNTYARILSRELANSEIRVIAVCPGWVRTDMGGANASRHVTEGARSIVWAAIQRSVEANGGFFRDGKPIPW